MRALASSWRGSAACTARSLCASTSRAPALAPASVLMSARLPHILGTARSPLPRVWPASCHFVGVEPRLSHLFRLAAPVDCAEGTAHQKTPLKRTTADKRTAALDNTDACARVRDAGTLFSHPTLPYPTLPTPTRACGEYVSASMYSSATSHDSSMPLLSTPIMRWPTCAREGPGRDHERTEDGSLLVLLPCSAGCSADCNGGTRPVLLAYSTESHTEPHKLNVLPHTLQCWHMSPPSACPRHRLPRRHRHPCAHCKAPCGGRTERPARLRQRPGGRVARRACDPPRSRLRSSQAQHHLRVRRHGSACGLSVCAKHRAAHGCT